MFNQLSTLTRKAPNELRIDAATSREIQIFERKVRHFSCSVILNLGVFAWLAEILVLLMRPFRANLPGALIL